MSSDFICYHPLLLPLSVSPGSFPTVTSDASYPELGQTSQAKGIALRSLSLQTPAASVSLTSHSLASDLRVLNTASDLIIQ